MESHARRIAMVSTHGYVAAQPEYGRPDTGGQVAYVLELSRQLGRLGFAVDVFTRRFEDQPEIDALDGQVRVVRIPCGGDGFVPKEILCRHIPEWVANAAAWIARQRLDYMFVDSHYWDAGLAGQALARRLRTPHVHTPHSIGSWKRQNMDGDPEDLERKYNFRERIRSEKAVYDECDLLLATTPQQRDLLCADPYDAPDAKIRVLPPGYDDTRFFPVSTATRLGLKRDLGLEGPIVFAVGRMAHNKGYDLLIRAMTTVLERVPSVRLLLAVGSTAPSPREIEQIGELRALAAELGAAHAVRLHDYIPDDRLADYYRAADVFALCSRYEPFGMTAIEAMACGTPTVITTEGGLWEQVVWGLEARCANPFDPQAFGHAIAHILQYPSVPEVMSKYGSQKARARFTWSSVAQQLLQTLETVAPQRIDAEIPSDGVVGPRAGWAVNPAEAELWRN